VHEKLTVFPYGQYVNVIVIYSFLRYTVLHYETEVGIYEKFAII